MRSVVIRPATATDLPAVMTIEDASFAPGLRETLPTYQARLALYPRGFRVAERGGAVVGFIASERWAGLAGLEPERFAIDHHPATHHQPEGDLLYLSALAVAPSARGHGVGAALIAGLLTEHAGAVRSALLVVARGWQAARLAYARAGFGEAMVLSRFFHGLDGSVDDGLVLRRELDRG